MGADGEQGNSDSKQYNDYDSKESNGDAEGTATDFEMEHSESSESGEEDGIDADLYRIHESGQMSGTLGIGVVGSLDDCFCQGDCGRPEMLPVQPGAKVFVSASTKSSRALASALKQAAQETSRIHGYSTAGTPWLYARRVAVIKAQNEQFLRWCREWISELYGVCGSSIRAARTEPHIVKYKSSASSSFKGIGTHQDGSFVTCIMALSESTEYSGGGTYFAHLDRTIHLQQGEVLLFQGKDGPFGAPHRAQPISRYRALLPAAAARLTQDACDAINFLLPQAEAEHWQSNSTWQ